MASTATTQAHIRVDEGGRAWINGTSYAVETLVLDHLAYGFSPAEIRHQHHNELSMAQIHAALAYYYDHKEQIEAQIQRDHAMVQTLRTAAGESPFVARMRAEGRLA